MAARLLIVEDDPALAELLVWHFEAEGYDVTQTADGEEALLLAAEEAPDAIILDWMIENISGIEAVSATPAKPFSATDHECLDYENVFLGVWTNGVVTRLKY